MAHAFYQRHWKTVGKEVCDAVLCVLNSNGSIDALNETFIVLIPKIKFPSKVTEFRHISLCNVLYKIISKTIANRLKKILPSIISQTQFAFVPGRLISDNVIVAFEALHTMNTKLSAKDGQMALKLDMSKTYDRIEWGFLEVVMLKMGFNQSWMIACCFIKLISLNGANSYTLFNLYERGSGQKLNKEKTSMQFSKNTPRSAQDLILSIAGVRSYVQYERYLGLPVMVGKSRINSFKCIQEKVKSKLSSYKVKTLSLAGKEIFIKAVVQALPSYSMRVFQLPCSFLKSINKVTQNYWWGQQEQVGRIHWVSYNSMGKAKTKGGLGFRDLGSFNVAMLDKQGWRLLPFPDSLASQVLKWKYFPRVSFMEAKVGSNPSYIWRSIMAARSLLDHGTCWRIGNGREV
ncbi:uncharacterized protein LOC118349865 [Juglans regia]|uniref:Uncharacterized protein LOC118349865 n=1 Tax=Juglans regia TaxID=51240 RepID=A0A6P9FAP1_JUGRE|nr:uncharacterized protein LOC118349865 [Juglans regia]